MNYCVFFIPQQYIQNLYCISMPVKKAVQRMSAYRDDLECAKLSFNRTLDW